MSFLQYIATMDPFFHYCYNLLVNVVFIIWSCKTVMAMDGMMAIWRFF